MTSADTSSKGNFQHLIDSKIRSNQKVEKDIGELEEELDQVLEELPLQLLLQSGQPSKSRSTVIADHVIDLIERKNDIKDKIESLVMI